MRGVRRSDDNSRKKVHNVRGDSSALCQYASDERRHIQSRSSLNHSAPPEAVSTVFSGRRVVVPDNVIDDGGAIRKLVRQQAIPQTLKHEAPVLDVQSLVVAELRLQCLGDGVERAGVLREGTLGLFAASDVHAVRLVDEDCGRATHRDASLWCRRENQRGLRQ
jgi:hypothetical protein